MEGNIVISLIPTALIDFGCLSLVIGNPFPLKQNAGKSFQGSIVLGKGFVLSQEEAEVLIKKDSRNKDVLYPYLNGEDLNNDPKQRPSRWIINFFDWPEERARSYRDCFEIVERLVKPERMQQNDKVGKEKWWQFLRPRNELYKTISQLDQVMAIALTSKTVAIAMLPSKQVFSHSLGVFSCSDFAMFSFMQSTIHNIWAWQYGSSMKSDLRYTPSNCFETFPFSALMSNGILETKGKDYFALRQTIMTNAGIGLTKLYNRFHDKNFAGDIISLVKQLRDLHVQIDLAILNSYGWDDLLPKHDFYEVEYLPENDRTRFTIHPSARKELLSRLLELNHTVYHYEKNKPFEEAQDSTRE